MYKSLLFTNRIEDYYLQIEYKVQNYGKKLIDLSRTEHRILSKAHTSRPPNPCGVRGWRRVTFQTAQYPVVICWSVTEAFVAVRVWFSLCCTGLFGWFGAALKTFFSFSFFFVLRKTLVVSKVLGDFFFSSETVSYRLMGPFESSRSVNSYPGSIGLFSNVQKNGQQKNVQLILQNCCKTSWIAMLRVLLPISNLSCNKSGC